MEFSHIPVLLEQAVDALAIKENGIYVTVQQAEEVTAVKSSSILQQASLFRLIRIPMQYSR